MDIDQQKPSKILMIPTEYTPCSLEYCPTGKLGSCGFYQTEQQPHRQSAYDRQEEEEEEEEEEGVNSPPVKRLGRCVLFESQLDEENDTVLYRQIQQFDCPAILDQRWTQDIDHPILMTADAEGNLNSYGLNRTGDSARLDLLDTYSCCAPGKEDVLCLSLDMSDKRWTASKRQVVCSLSSGEIVLLGQDSEERSLSLVEAHRWKAHGYEAWTCAFDYWHPHSILTGGDDCQLKLWDTRNTLLQPVLVNKQFDGGVTAARSDHLREHLFAVGSYDCKLRVFDARNFREPLMSEDVGGGIWRIKWDESRVLLATMHAGFRVLSLTQEDSDESRADSHPPAVANAYPQKIRSLTLSKVSDNVQLAYGADWFPSGSRTLVAGCSFYDRALYFWNIPSA